MKLINAFLEALAGIGNIFRYFTHRSEQKNRPDVVDAKKRSEEVEKQSRTEASIARRDEDEARKEWAE